MIVIDHWPVDACCLICKRMNALINIKIFSDNMLKKWLISVYITASIMFPSYFFKLKRLSVLFTAVWTEFGRICADKNGRWDQAFNRNLPGPAQLRRWGWHPNRLQVIFVNFWSEPNNAPQPPEQAFPPLASAWHIASFLRTFLASCRNLPWSASSGDQPAVCSNIRCFVVYCR